MSIITLTTDFGSDDHYVAAMKGVILSINPQATIVDITHAIPPQDIRAGAWALLNAAPYFPVGTIHVCVVDPGVGSERWPIALHSAGHTFVGPDNGVLTLAAQALSATSSYVQAIQLTQRAYWRPTISHTFHGRDIFSPVAAHLSKGVALAELGEPITDYQLLRWPVPTEQADGVLGEIIHIDRFGNCITNIPAHRMADMNPIVVLGETQIDNICKMYAEAARGTLLALIGSSGYLELAVRDGNAAERLGAKVGDIVRVKTN